VRKNLQTFSSDLFAAQRDDLCGQLHLVYPGRYILLWLCTCGSLPVESKAYIAKQKKRHG
jgi:hypothetical protein